jgi:anaphase-promoting complex subunit 1
MGRVMEMHASKRRNRIPILESCLGWAAVALAMVLSGSGDLDALRVFKILRWRCDNDSQYGSHMRRSLGGGTCTLGRNPADIAALVTAFFPRFPITTTDN